MYFYNGIPDNLISELVTSVIGFVGSKASLEFEDLPLFPERNFCTSLKNFITGGTTALNPFIPKFAPVKNATAARYTA